MTFPTIAPTDRQYTAGNWPVRTFTSQSGAEVRLLYGNRRFGHTLTLQYSNISDTQAEEFFTDYYAQKGTFTTFALPQPLTDNVGKGWSGSTEFFNAGVGAQWRYAEPPQLVSVYPGVSSVSITLVAAGVGGGT